MDTPYSIHVLSETGSTQDDARSTFSGEPVLVVASAQKSGRGRGRAHWHTAPRALAASLALSPPWRADQLPLLPVLAGVAATRVVDCDLKWPNDVVRGELKLGGILVEASDAVAVVGFGLNLWWPDPPEGFGAVYEADPGPDNYVTVGEGWAAALWSLVEDGPASWPRDEYRARCSTLGREIVWEPDGHGIARDVDEGGALIVDQPSGVARLVAGEVRHVRSAGDDLGFRVWPG